MKLVITAFIVNLVFISLVLLWVRYKKVRRNKMTSSTVKNAKVYQHSSDVSFDHEKKDSSDHKFKQKYFHSNMVRGGQYACGSSMSESYERFHRRIRAPVSWAVLVCL
jgi:hypothetical protein